MAPSIYILSSERSGTNLLRSLLSNHPQYEGPIPIHFFDTFFHAANRYGNLCEQGNMHALLTDAVALANHPYHDWTLQLDATQLLEKYRPTNLFAAFQALYGAWCEQHGAHGMICKDNNLFHYAFYIRAHDPAAKFIYLYRDVRAYCASWKGVPAMHKTTYQNARHWVAEQTTCLNLMTTHGIDCVPVAYEELVGNTPATIDRIFAHIGVAADARCYQTAAGKNDAAAERNEFWKNINKPVFDSGAEAYRKKLDADEIAMIEAVAGSVMQRLGYQPEAAVAWKKPRWFSLQEKLRKKKLKRTVFKGEDLLQSKTDLVRRIQHGKPALRGQAKTQ
ncbi:MAG TPA: sulfotransferase [Pseudomonadales bacterium]|nr:sulfotransferase [Pseudomonadales bacterium]